MTTARTRIIAHRSTGPADLTLVLPAGRIAVVADSTITTAVVVLNAIDPADQDAATAITHAEETVCGSHLTVRVRPVVADLGLTVTSGQIIVGTGATGSSDGLRGRIDAAVRVPPRSSLVLELGHGDIEISGQACLARLESTINGTVVIAGSAH